MNNLSNDLLIRALLRKPVERTPVWMMRQAGRYLPEYREVRRKAGDFLNLCMTPELACQVTLQPVDRFGFDAAILFSDILTIPHAMGLGLYFVEGEGPKFQRPVHGEQDVNQLPVPDPESELRYVCDAVRLIRKELAGRVPLIGFSGSPWTLATYMIEGGASRDFRKAKTMLYQQPSIMHRLLAKLSDAVSAYLNAQIAAGAQAVMLFDTWGGVLAQGDYRDFSLHYASRVVEQLQTCHGEERVPTILFTKGGGQWLEAMAQSGYDALGLDWTTDIGEARGRVGQQAALQGNMDPLVLYASPDVVKGKVRQVLDGFGDGPGHVFNLGHGVLPDVDPDHVAVMVEAVKEYGVRGEE